MGLELLSRWSPEGLLLESPAEDHLARLLEEGPGTNTRALFARAPGWREALTDVAEEPAAILRSQLIVFPQVWVGQYRTDFMVVCGDPGNVLGVTQLSSFAFFVECDGRIGHAENAEQIRADRERERTIRMQTGLPVLRFSGAEVMYQKTEVAALIGAQVEALSARREYGTQLASHADAILEAVADLSSHRALRNDYTLRNSERVTEDPYDPCDPFGEDGFPARVIREAEWDPFLDLRLKLAQLRHAVANARLASNGWEDDEPDGAPRPFAEVLARVLAAISASVERQEKLAT
jgi:hypothetical protein